jgi:uncharacterized membrane protein
MGIGGSIFLIALGAIIAFGVKRDLSWLDLDVVGWVFMLCGLTGLVLTVSFWMTRRRTQVIERPHNARNQEQPRA